MPSVAVCSGGTGGSEVLSIVFYFLITMYSTGTWYVLNVNVGSSLELDIDIT